MFRCARCGLTHGMTTNTSTHPDRPPTTLVIGGTGMSGRRVAAQLTARGVPVRIGTRSARPPFDWRDRSTWALALRGVGAAYLTYHPDIGSPDAATQIDAFARQAEASGVERLVLLSGRGSTAALAAERALRDSTADWAIVRSSWFAQNFTEGFLADLVRSGRIAFPAADVAEPFIDADDVAAVAVAALTEDRHTHQVHEVTGPRLLTFADVAVELSGVAAQPVRYEPITFAQFDDGLTRAGMPAEAAAGTVAVFREILDGRNAQLSDGVRRVLGRPPTDFADWAQAAAANGAWRT